MDRALGQLRSRILTIYALVDRYGLQKNLQKLFVANFWGQILDSRHLLKFMYFKTFVSFDKGAGSRGGQGSPRFLDIPPTLFYQHSSLPLQPEDCFWRALNWLFFSKINNFVGIFCLLCIIFYQHCSSPLLPEDCWICFFCKLNHLSPSRLFTGTTLNNFPLHRFESSTPAKIKMNEINFHRLHIFGINL